MDKGMPEDRKNTIPIIIGATGHRAVREQDVPAIRDAVRAELRKLQALCPHSSVVLLTSLAEGGDLLCADVAEELGIPLVAVLPTVKDVYEQDFSPEGKQRLAHHCARAELLFIAPDAEPLPDGFSEAGDKSLDEYNVPEHANRSFRFRQAGIYVASHCLVLLALWDGGPGTDAACGTAEAVDFALNGNYKPISGEVPRQEGSRAVIHILTPRETDEETSAGAVRVLGDWPNVQLCLKRTDDFNRRSAELISEKRPMEKSRLPEAARSDPALEKMDRLSLIAGTLSTESAKKYRLVLALLAVASALLTFAFLMYDEAEAIWMILVCGVMLLGAWACQLYAVRSDCHRRYLEYRALAECLRVQTYLRYAGSRIRTVELLTWTQQMETAWIVGALSVLEIAGPACSPHDICDCWVEDQLRYHRQAERRTKKALSSSERVVRFSLILSVTLYCAAVVFELLFGNLILPPVAVLRNVEVWRTVLKILLGTISAVTLFISNFYGRQSLSRRESDHRKMEQFFIWISGQLAAHGQTEELLTMLAREELIENGNWCSYQRDNRPDISF